MLTGEERLKKIVSVEARFMRLLKAYLHNPNTQRILNRKPGDKGFSLIELVVVVAVLAVLSAVAIPSFTSLSDDARLNSAKQVLSNAYKECEFNKARTGSATHTAAVDQTPNGVTWNAMATGTGCTGEAVATVATSCKIGLNYTTGAQTDGAGTTKTWPKNFSDC